MLQSILEDIKRAMRTGNMITKLIIINVTVFVVTALVKAFAPSFYAEAIQYLAISSDPVKILLRPWTIITHMFVHSGGWHILWNMLFLYWFGAIVGDLLNDKRILPLYFLGGLAGAVVYILSFHLAANVTGTYAVGASAAVMALVTAAGVTSPDYNMKLILLGDVKLKYIVFFVVFMDVISVGGYDNAGGHFAHLGGAAFGFLFVRLLRTGTDLSEGFNQLTNRILMFFSEDEKPKKSRLKVSYRSGNRYNKFSKKTSQSDNSPKMYYSHQEELDKILDKIKNQGMDSLSEEEKDFLHQASKDE